MTAENFNLIPKQFYVKEQPHAARVFHDNNKTDNNAQMSYLNLLIPQLLLQTSEPTVTKETFTEIAELQQKQLKLLMDDEEVPVNRDEVQILEEKNDRLT